MTKTITDIDGVFANGAHCGIKESGLDLSFIFVPEAVASAGVFTKNKFCAPCINHTRKAVREAVCKAIVINSGNANAVTGEQGVRDVIQTAKIASSLLGISEDEVAIASTGIIGKKLPMEKIESGLRNLLADKEVKEGVRAAEGILTTDTEIKICFYEKNGIQVAGIAKGSGMIAPNMATMLGFFVTNVSTDNEYLQSALSSAVAKSFNMISVDTDTSTSDMVLCLASGTKDFDGSESSKKIFSELLDSACVDLAKRIVDDGEGASRVIEVTVRNAASDADAKEIALSIANSPLVKTAVHGADPNWGRIVMAIGKTESATVKPELVDVYFQDTPVLLAGAPVDFERDSLIRDMQKHEVGITVDMHLSDFEATAWGCDLTKGYIDINTCYN